MNTLTEQAAARCRSWVKHSTLGDAEIAKRACLAKGTVQRFRRGGNITLRALMAIESTVPKNWRDPLPAEKLSA
jgi:hypothetical protein